MAFLNYSAEELLNDPVLMQEFVNNVQQSIEEAAGESGGEGVTYSLEGTASGSTVTYTLDAESGTDSSIGFTAGTGMSFTYNTNTQTITINATGGDSEGNYVTVDTTTGEIKEGANVFQYLYRYLHVRFSANSNGSGFVADPASVSGSSIYIGLANRSTITAPTEASNYNWTEYTWGSINNVFYRKTGGNRIEFLTSTQSSVGDAIDFVSGDSPLDFNVLEINTGNIADAAITSTKITNTAITAPKIAANAITTDKIEANAVVAGKIATDAITTDKIEANAVVAGKIAADAVTAVKIQAGAVDTDKIAAAAITSAKLQNGAVDTDALAEASIIASKLATNAVIADKVAANAITADKIAADAVTATKIDVDDLSAISADLGTITAGTIDASQATINNINASNITSGILAAGRLSTTTAYISDSAMVGDSVIVGANLQDSEIGSTKIAGGAVTSSAIATGAVTADAINVTNLAAISANMGTITAGNISAELITSGTLNASRLALDGQYITTNTDGELILSDEAVDTAQLANDAVNNAKISTGAVDSDSIALNSIAAKNIAAGAITADTIAAEAVTAAAIKTGTITGDKIDATTVIARTVQSSNYDPRNPINGDGPADAGYSLEAGNGIIYAEEVHANLTGTVTAPSSANVVSGERKYFSTAATRKFVDANAGATLKTFSSPNGTYTAKYYIGEPIWVLDLEDSDLITAGSNQDVEVDGVNAATSPIKILNTLDCYVIVDNVDTDQFTSSSALANAGLILEAYDADDEFYAVATSPIIVSNEDNWGIRTFSTSSRIWFRSDGSFHAGSDIDSTGVSFVIETNPNITWRFFFDSTASDFVVNDIKKLKVYLGVGFEDSSNPDQADPADFVTALPFDLEMGTLQDSQVEIEVPVTGAGKNITVTQESGL